MAICVLFPTATEMGHFAHPGVETLISGVGLTATAYQTLKTIHSQQPDWLILAGVAGVYPHAHFPLTDVRLVSSEVEGDLGFFTPEGFVHLAHLPLDMAFERRHTLSCPWLERVPAWPTARSATVNAALAPFIDTQSVELENMEGAAFFHVCLKEQQPFLEMRAISNVVEPGHDDWDIQAAVDQLHLQLHRLLDELLQGPRP